MRKKSVWLVLLSTAMMVIAFYHVGRVHATPSSGFTATTLALGRFGPIKVFNHFVPPNVKGDDREDNIWTSLQKTKGQSDLYIQSNVWQPGGNWLALAPGSQSHHRQCGNIDGI